MEGVMERVMAEAEAMAEVAGNAAAGRAPIAMELAAAAVAASSSPAPQATQILRHHVYPGARPGSLHHVYVRVRYADGSAPRGYVPAAPLAASDALWEYACRTPAFANYVPADVMAEAAVVAGGGGTSGGESEEEDMDMERVQWVQCAKVRMLTVSSSHELCCLCATGCLYVMLVCVTHMCESWACFSHSRTTACC